MISRQVVQAGSGSGGGLASGTCRGKGGRGGVCSRWKTTIELLSMSEQVDQLLNAEAKRAEIESLPGGDGSVEDSGGESGGGWGGVG